MAPTQSGSRRGWRASGFAKAGSTKPRRCFEGWSSVATPTISSAAQATWPAGLPLRDASKAEEALGLIDRAIEVRGPNVALTDTRAVVLIRAGKIDQALRELQDAQKVDPRNPNLARHLAWAYQQTGGGTDQARTALREAEAFGWRPARSDPLERRFMDQLRQDLSHVSQPPGDRSPRHRGVRISIVHRSVIADKPTGFA